MARAYDYPTWAANVQEMLGVADPNGIALFNSIQFQMIDFAELRIYRDLQLLDTSTALSFAATANNRYLNITAGTFVMIDDANVILPAAANPDDPGSSRQQLRRVSREFLDFACGDGTTDVPAYFDVFNTDQLILGPTPNLAYVIELIGTVRPPPLGDGTNGTAQTTILTTQFPDLFLAASMIFGSAWQKNFGQQADNPQMALSWEAVYGALKGGASMEEALKKGEAPMMTQN